MSSFLHRLSARALGLETPVRSSSRLPYASVPTLVEAAPAESATTLSTWLPETTSSIGLSPEREAVLSTDNEHRSPLLRSRVAREREPASVTEPLRLEAVPSPSMTLPNADPQHADYTVHQPSLLRPRVATERQPASVTEPLYPEAMPSPSMTLPSADAQHAGYTVRQPSLLRPRLTTERSATSSSHFVPPPAEEMPSLNSPPSDATGHSIENTHRQPVPLLPRIAEVTQPIRPETAANQAFKVATPHAADITEVGTLAPPSVLLPRQALPVRTSIPAARTTSLPVQKHQQESQGGDIQVTIGRVEIAAVHAPAPTPAPRPAQPAHKMMSLQEYFARRRQGRE